MKQIVKESLEDLTPLTEEELQQVSGGNNFGDLLRQWWWSVFRGDD
ncbi:COMC family protein [Streptococcus sp. oral taxon 056 str. F0418]|nr:bacteriocin [Streptococcus sp. oral taxon 056]EGP65944.1 COMC family protein [Streptococcus sp. oral taxon 056 str. F0418]